MENSLLTIYNGLKSKNPSLPEYSKFQTDMADEGKRRQVYDGLKGKNPGLPEFNLFSRDMGFGDDGRHLQSVSPYRLSDQPNSGEKSVDVWKDYVVKPLNGLGISPSMPPIPQSVIDVEGLEASYNGMDKEYKPLARELAKAKDFVREYEAPPQARTAFAVASWENKKKNWKDRYDKDLKFVQENEEKVMDYEKRLRYTQDAIDLAVKAKELEDYDGDAGFFKQLFRGATSGLFKDFASFGLKEIARSTRILDLNERASKGESLTDEEKKSLDMFYALQAMEGSTDTSVGYEIGRGIKDLLPFAVEFAVSGGMTAAGRTALKKALQVGVEKGVSNFTKKAVVHGADAMARTALTPHRVASDFLDRRNANYETDESGQINLADDPSSISGDLGKAYFSQFTEIASENLLTGVPVPKFVRNNKIAKRLSGLVPKKVDEGYRKLMQDIGMSNPLYEYAEENIGNVAQAWVTGDRRVEDVFNNKEQLTTLGVCIAGSGIPSMVRYAVGGAVKATQYVSDQGKFKKSREVFREVFPDVADDVIGTFEKGELPDIVDKITTLSKGIDDEKKVVLYDYASRAFNQRGKQDIAEEAVKRNIGEFVDKQTGNVEFVQDFDGNEFHVIDRSTVGDKLMFVVSDGTSKRELMDSQVMSHKAMSREDFVNQYVLAMSGQGINIFQNEEAVNNEPIDDQRQLSVDGAQKQVDGSAVFEPGQAVMRGEEPGHIQRVESDGTAIVAFGDPLDGGHVDQVPLTELQTIETSGGEQMMTGRAQENEQTGDAVQETPQIPLRKDGKVDYNALLEQNPVLFAEEWEKRSTPEKTKDILVKQSENVVKKIKALQDKLDKETDFNKIADIEDSITELEGKKSKIDDVLTTRYTEADGTESVDGRDGVQVPEEKQGNGLPEGDNVVSLLEGSKNVNSNEISESISQGEHGEVLEGVRGIEEKAYQLRRRIEEASGDAPKGERSGSSQQEINRMIESQAKASGLWTPIQNLSDLGSPFLSGSENETYLDAKNRVVYKVNNLMNSKSLPDLFRRIDLHNDIFPQTSYELVGFTGFGNGGTVYPIYRQMFVDNTVFATPEEIDGYMRSLGFNHTGEVAYSNGEVVISDLRPRNVLKSANRNMYVVDADFKRESALKKEVKKVMTPFQKELMELGDPADAKEVVAKAIAQGMKVKMDDGKGSRGFAAHLGIDPGTKEYKSFFNIRNEKDGFTPEQMAENLIANDQSGFLDGMDSKDLADLIIELMPQISSRRKALEYMKGNHIQLAEGEDARVEQLKYEEEMEEFGMPYEDWLVYMNRFAEEQKKILDTVNPIDFYSNFENEHVNNTENERNIQRSERTEVSDSGRPDHGNRHEDRNLDSSRPGEDGERSVTINSEVGVREDGRSKSGENGYGKSDYVDEQAVHVVPDENLVAERESGTDRGDNLADNSKENQGTVIPGDQLTKESTPDSSSKYVQFRFLDGSIQHGEVIGSEDGRVVIKGDNGRTYRVHPDSILSRYGSEAEMSAAMKKANEGDGDVRFRKISDNTQEESEIIEKSKAAGIYLKAPNGKASKLNERQWVQVRTKAFKDWFGDWENDPKNASKVVDENGEPLVVYHGSQSAGFTIFEEQSKGFFFTDSMGMALPYSGGIGFSPWGASSRGVYRCFLNLQNPVEVNADGRTWDALCFELDGRSFDSAEEIVDYIREYHSEYDGVVVKNVEDGDTNRQVGADYVAICQNQIKDAYANSGEFSTENDDVRFREAQTENPEAVNARFNEELSQLTDENADRVVFHLGTPSIVLLSAGVSNKPMKLYGNKVIKKMKKHGFALSELENLPRAVANPIAVFNNIDRIGNRSILTELETVKGNVLVSVDLGKGMDADFNIISSAFGKSERSVVDWINRGLGTYINKEKALDYLHHPALIAETSNSQGLSSATNIVKNFENPSVSDGEISSVIDELSGELGVEVKRVKSRGELPDGIKRQMGDGRYPGVFDPKTGNVYVVTDEIKDVADAQATVLHEVLGHKGMRGLFGDRLPEFCSRVLTSMDEQKRAELVEKHNGDEQLAAEEYVASFAEEYTDPSSWEKVKAVVKEFFRELGIDLKLSDNDLKYLLWKAKNGLKKGDTAVSAIEKIAGDRKVQDVLFRNPDIRKAENFVNEKMSAAEEFGGKQENPFVSEAVKPVGRGFFGNIYDQFRGRVKEAFDFLLTHREGDLLGVFHRDDIGDIDLVWGKDEDKTGLAHIIEKHIKRQNDFASVDEAMEVIRDVVNNGIPSRENLDKIVLDKDGYRVVIGKQLRDGNGNMIRTKNWVITGFDRSKNKKKKTLSEKTLTTPPSDPEADGVTLPSNSVSLQNKDSEKSGGKQENPFVSEAVKPVGRGFFGNIYDQFRGRVKEAFDFLLTHREGDLLGVFHRDDIGDIDLVWGKDEDKTGLAHIIEKHIKRQNDFASVDEAMAVINDVVNNGHVVKNKGDKMILAKDNYKIIIRKNIKDGRGKVIQNKNWVVTAFDYSRRKDEKTPSNSSHSTPTVNLSADGGSTLPSNEVLKEISPDSSQ